MNERGSGQRNLMIAIVVAASLATANFVVGFLAGSLIVLAFAADSFADALMSSLNLWGYRHARTPADAEHPYGHGKIEGVLATAQGMLLVGVTGSLVAACVFALLEGERQTPQVPLAVVAIVVSGTVSLALSWILSHTPKESSSAVVEADAAHYRVDFLTALAGVTGLVLVSLTDLAWIDPVTSLVMALVMGREAAKILRRSAAELLDEALPPEELQALQAVLDANAEHVLTFHGLRTRRSGPLRFVEVHAVLPPELTLGAAHELAETIGNQLRETLPNCRVLVHPDAKGHADSVDLPLE